MFFCLFWLFRLSFGSFYTFNVDFIPLPLLLSLSSLLSWSSSLCQPYKRNHINNSTYFQVPHYFKYISFFMPFSVCSAYRINAYLCAYLHKTKFLFIFHWLSFCCFYVVSYISIWLVACFCI